MCLINATAVGCEVLKSLVLPGIGRFTVIDGQTVTQTDLGTNFFLDPHSVGKNRAESACSMLKVIKFVSILEFCSVVSRKFRSI